MKALLWGQAACAQREQLLAQHATMAAGAGPGCQLPPAAGSEHGVPVTDEVQHTANIKVTVSAVR